MNVPLCDVDILSMNLTKRYLDQIYHQTNLAVSMSVSLNNHKIVLFLLKDREILSVLIDGLSFVIVVQIIPFTTGSMFCLEVPAVAH